VNRLLEQLDDEHRVLANQLRAGLLRYIPGLLVLCEGADELWFWALVEKGPLEALRKVRATTWAKLLKLHRKRSVTVDMLTGLLAQPHPQVPEVVSQNHALAALLIIKRLRLVEQQRKMMEKKQKLLLLEMSARREDGKPSDVEILLSMPGIAEKTAAIFLVEAGEALRACDLQTLRAVSGVAPVTKRSGKTSVVMRRRACNSRLSEAIFHAAGAAAKHAPKFQRIGRRSAERGHTRGRIHRDVGDTMLTVLTAMMKSRTLYQESAPPAPTSAAAMPVP
jgi:hypothetical protein